MVDVTHVRIVITLWAVAMTAMMPIINKLEVPGKIRSVEMGVDKNIPLIVYFIIPYLSYFPFFVLGWVYLFFFSGEYYVSFVISFGLIGLIANIIFVVFQTSAPRAKIESNDIHSRLLRWHYSLARPVNALPSLHVAHSICVGIFLALEIPSLFLLWYFISSLISIATLLTKEHYLLDVVAGLILGAGVPYMVLVVF